MVTNLTLSCKIAKKISGTEIILTLPNFNIEETFIKCKVIGVILSFEIIFSYLDKENYFELII